MKLLHIIPTVNPDYGGPVAALIEADIAGRKCGVTRTVATLDCSDDPWIRHTPLATVPLGSSRVRRARGALPWLRYGFTPHLVSWLRHNVGLFDRVVVHGLWNYATFAARCVLPGGRVPYYVYPHGMLDPWFRGAFPLKHGCKQASWWVNEGPLLRHAEAVLFTCEGERRAAEASFRPYRLCGIVAGYGTGDAPPRTERHERAFAACVPGLQGRPFLLFLGRLHPKKGCDLLLEAFASSGLPNHHLVMAGPDDARWQPELVKVAAALGIGARVHFPGMLSGDSKWGALHGCDAFVLPSHGENFGVAVAEALSCGKPVLLSDRVNIAADIRNAAAGLVAPDTAPGVRDLLRGFAALGASAKHTMGDQARACFLDHFLADTVQARTLAIIDNPEPFR